jgi:hypothetical protein
VGVTGSLGQPPPEYLEVMRFVDRQVGLGKPDMRGVFSQYKRDFNRKANRLIRLPLLVVLLVPSLVLAILWVEGTCCLSLAVVAIVGVYLLMMIIAEIPVVVERPNGFEKESIQGYKESFKVNEGHFADEGLAFVKIDVSDFFLVSEPTHLYIFELGPPPLYAVIWRMEGKSLCHVGYRTEENSDRLKRIASKTGRL